MAEIIEGVITGAQEVPGKPGVLRILVVAKYGLGSIETPKDSDRPVARGTDVTVMHVGGRYRWPDTQ